MVIGFGMKPTEVVAEVKKEEDSGKAKGVGYAVFAIPLVLLWGTICLIWKFGFNAWILAALIIAFLAGPGLKVCKAAKGIKDGEKLFQNPPQFLGKVLKFIRGKRF